MTSPDDDFETIPLSILFRRAGEPTKYKILTKLNQRDATPSELSDTLKIRRSNITSQLSDLRELGFVDYQRQGRNHRYSIREPLPTFRHELILEMIDLDPTDPDRKFPGKTEQNPEEIKRKLQKTKRKRLRKKLQLWATYLDHPGLTSPNPTRKKLKEQIKNLTRKINRFNFRE